MSETLNNLGKSKHSDSYEDLDKVQDSAISSREELSNINDSQNIGTGQHSFGLL